jgi:hypothetical protein
VIVHPQGENLGSIELIGWDGAQPGRDFSERAKPPNLGAMALRFGVTDLAAHLDRLRGQGILPARPVTELALEPYGRVRLAPWRSPDGVWLEFFEVGSRQQAGTVNTAEDTLAYQDLSPDDILSSVESLGFRCDGRL